MGVIDDTLSAPGGRWFSGFPVMLKQSLFWVANTSSGSSVMKFIANVSR